jgi:hypothetical protein
VARIGWNGSSGGATELFLAHLAAAARGQEAEDVQAGLVGVTVDYHVGGAVAGSRIGAPCVGARAVGVGHTEVHEVHPHGVNGGVVTVILVLLRHRHEVLLNNVGLAVHVELGSHHAGRHHGPEQGVENDIFLVLSAGFCLGFFANAARVVQIDAWRHKHQKNERHVRLRHAKSGPNRVMVIRTSLAVRARSDRDESAAWELTKLRCCVKQRFGSRTWKDYEQ